MTRQHACHVGPPKGSILGLKGTRLKNTHSQGFIVASVIKVPMAHFVRWGLAALKEHQNPARLSG